jgi:hypothetical protein
MKNKMIFAFITGCVYTSLSAANFDVGISGSDRGINGFSLSIGDYYRVPQQEVVVIERSIPREEMSVVYYLASKSHRDARYISNMRARGLSWWDITFRLGLDPRTIYVIHSRQHFGPPYGQAYGYSKHKKHHLRDAEIVELVNVRFLSDYHHISPDEVIKRRRGGEHYMNIDEHYRGHRDRNEVREERRDERQDQRQDDRGSHGGNDRGSNSDNNDRGHWDQGHGNNGKGHER